MASYEELLVAGADDALNRKVRVAVVVAAETIYEESPGTPNHQARIDWAQLTIASPKGAAEQMMPAMLAKEKNETLADIVGMTDAEVQTSVDSIVDLFAL